MHLLLAVASELLLLRLSIGLLLASVALEGLLRLRLPLLLSKLCIGIGLSLSRGRTVRLRLRGGCCLATLLG